MSEAAPFQRVAVVGLGVMGGSFARALTGTAAAPEVRGWSHDADERRAALYAGAVMAAPEDLKEALQKADLVAIATPLQAACRLIADIAADTLARDATIMDVSGLKAPVARAAAKAGVASRFVGAHPMAGSEASGFPASRPDLFEGGSSGSSPNPTLVLIPRRWRRCGVLWARGPCGLRRRPTIASCRW
jgi:prephenate dehydrogenase